MIGPAIRRPPKGDNSIYVAIVLVNLPDIPFSKYSGLPYIHTERFYAAVKNLTASLIGRIKIRKNGKVPGVHQIRLKIVEPSIIALSRVGIEKIFSG